LGEIGSLDTTNYAFGFDIRKGVTSVNRLPFLREWNEVKAKYTWPISRLETNTAFLEASQILRKANVDVNAINRDAESVSITASVGPDKKDFVPVYWITWKRTSTNGLFSPSSSGQIASFVFLEPTKTIYQLHVFDPKYILRKPLEPPDFMALLTTDPTNNPPEYVLREINAGTNAEMRDKISTEYGASETDLKRWELKTNALAETNPPGKRWDKIGRHAPSNRR
jgi:hypothetical protein